MKEKTAAILILCEGINDLLLIEACLKLFYSAVFPETSVKKGVDNKGEKTSSLCEIRGELQVCIIQVKGCKNLSDPLYINELIDNTDNGGQNIIIFDADEPGYGNNGFKSCCQKLDDIRRQENVSFEQFLWPNNEQDGKVEDLLIKLIPETYKAVYRCIETHQDCLRGLADEVKDQIKFAELKDKVGYYLHTLSQSSQASKRDYTQRYWDLNPDANNDLRRLKTFLDKYLELE